MFTKAKLFGWLYISYEHNVAILREVEKNAFRFDASSKHDDCDIEDIEAFMNEYGYRLV